MGSDVAAVRARSRRAYETGRARRAAWLSLPLASVAVLAWMLGTAGGVAVALGAVVVVLSFALLHAGESVGRAVLPGIGAGLIPFALVHLGHMAGPSCASLGSCDDVCLAACGGGGLLAGFVVAHATRSAARRVPALLAGGALATAVGALGCACIGVMGTAAVAVGLAVAATPGLVLSRARA